MFVILITYTRPIEEIVAKTDEHRAWLQQHVDSGLLIATGPMVPRTGGVLLARGGSTKDELESLFKADPFRIHDLATYRVIEFSPVKFNPALAEFI